MNILIFNCGSSSQKFKLFNVPTQNEYREIASGKARNVGVKTLAEPVIDWDVRGQGGSILKALPDHRSAARAMLEIIKQNGVAVDAIGHRFVHGGEVFDRTARIDPGTLAQLRECLPLAPIHNPNSYSVIQVCLDVLPGVPQFAVFDTAFHARMPEESRLYAIPQDLAKKYGFRKYGFHGLSYQFVSAEAARQLDRPIESVKLIMCHLGTGGASVTAFKDGRTLDTSMGFSPLPGLVMSTRCGDIDPEIVLEMIRQGYSVDEVDDILNIKSGLVGLSGYSSNLAEIIKAGQEGNRDCQTAFEVYAHRLKMYLGAYTWLLNGADALIFTDDIGMKSWELRQQVCRDADRLGILLDEQANRSAPNDRVSWINRPDSPTKILLVPTDEELVILKQVLDRV